jgi:hypothetical protein
MSAPRTGGARHADGNHVGGPYSPKGVRRLHEVRLLSNYLRSTQHPDLKLLAHLLYLAYSTAESIHLFYSLPEYEERAEKKRERLRKALDAISEVPYSVDGTPLVPWWRQRAEAESAAEAPDVINLASRRAELLAKRRCERRHEP